MNLEMSDDARDLLVRERLVISDLRTLLSRLDAEDEDLQELKNALRDLEGIFMLVVCGEYNAGKSTFLNALLGEKVMLEGVTPTTDRITIVSYGEQPRDIEESGLILRREHPAAILRTLAVVDTPGTNAIIKKHQELTERFIPRADLVLFVTSVDRPFTESERSFLELISSWGKKIVIVVNKFDILESDEERERVLAFVREHSRDTLGVTPQVFGIRARQALRATQAGDRQTLKESGLPVLMRFIEESLGSSQRLKIKMGSPLGVAQHVADTYEGVIKRRLALLEDDRRTLDEIDRQIEQFQDDMKREFQNHLVRVKTVLLEVERRGDVFFDDMVRLRRALALMNNEQIRETYEVKVIRGADREVDRAAGEIVDWFINRNLQLWEDIMRYLTERRKAGDERVIGEVGGRFQYDRETLLRNISQSAREVMASYDGDQESRRLANSLQSAALQTGIMQVGGLGLGAAIVAFLSGATFDITGILAGLTIVTLGLFVLPNRRQRAKRELHEKMQELRDGLSVSLSERFQHELRRASERLDAAVNPYTRFVRSELRRLEELEQSLHDAKTSLRQLRVDVESLTPVQG